MDATLFNGTTVNIIIGFAILAFALIAIFTDSTPVKWISGLLALFGIGLLYRRLFPSDAELKQRYEENKALANRYYDDRKNALTIIQDNRQKLEKLKSKKQEISAEDISVNEQVAIVDTEIAKLEKQNEELEKSITKRQQKLDSFFSRKDFPTDVATSGNATNPPLSPSSTNTSTSTLSPRSTPASATISVGEYQLKGDVE